MKLGNLFNFNSFTYKDLFINAVELWDPVKNLDPFLAILFENKEKKILIGKGSSIDPKTNIEGLVIIGNNSKIKDGVLLRDGVIIGNNCTIGHASEIKHSVIMDNTTTAHFNYIGDSILGNNVSFAAGVITANFKQGAENEIVNVDINGQTKSTGLRKLGALVGDGAKIGCNSVLDPGTIVGKNTLIYPLAAVRGTLPANKILKYKQSFEIVDKK